MCLNRDGILQVSATDVTATKGIRTSSGSKFFGQYVPEEDALLIQRI